MLGQREGEQERKWGRNVLGLLRNVGRGDGARGARPSWWKGKIIPISWSKDCLSHHKPAGWLFKSLNHCQPAWFGLEGTSRPPIPTLSIIQSCISLLLSPCFQYPTWSYSSSFPREHSLEHKSSVKLPRTKCLVEDSIIPAIPGNIPLVQPQVLEKERAKRKETKLLSCILCNYFPPCCSEF